MSATLAARAGEIVRADEVLPVIVYTVVAEPNLILRQRRALSATSAPSKDTLVAPEEAAAEVVIVDQVSIDDLELEDEQNDLNEE